MAEDGALANAQSAIHAGGFDAARQLGESAVAAEQAGLRQKAYRKDKTAAEADTVDTVRAMFEGANG